jgi:hypothetical protein
MLDTKFRAHNKDRVFHKRFGDETYKYGRSKNVEGTFGIVYMDGRGSIPASI